MTDQPRKRITIDPPDSSTILAARHLDATEGPVRVGSTVDPATRAAITRVLDYIAKAHNSPVAPTDLPTSTAPAAAAHPLVQGRCPACRGASLFLGSCGYVTCARLDCPNPSAADELLHGETDASGWTRQKDGTWTFPIDGAIITAAPHWTPEHRAKFAAEWERQRKPAPGTTPVRAVRHVHVTITNPDEFTANRAALSVADLVRAEFPGLHVTTDAREWPATTATQATDGPDRP